MIRNLAFAAAVSVLGTTPAFAGESNDICPDMAVDARGRACIRQLLSYSEQSLTTMWRFVFAKFGGSGDPSGRALLAEQRAWIAFKDKACGLYFLPGLSAMEWSNGQRCKIRLIDNRTVALDEMQRALPGED